VRWSLARRASSVPGAHVLVRGSIDGWFVCSCGCGYVAVCRHCVPAAPGSVSEAFCDGEQRRLKIGKYAEGRPRTREEWVRAW